MKINIRKAKTKLFAKSEVFYVGSKSGGEEHIVVQNNGTYFCDCKDFMTRRLPLFGTTGFTLCTHGKQVVSFLIAQGYGAEAPPKRSKQKYGIFRPPDGNRSEDLTKVYFSRQKAEKAIKDYEFEHGVLGRYAQII